MKRVRVFLNKNKLILNTTLKLYLEYDNQYSKSCNLVIINFLMDFFVLKCTYFCGANQVRIHTQPICNN